MNLDISTREGAVIALIIFGGVLLAIFYVALTLPKDLERAKAKQNEINRANQVFVRKMRVLEQIVEKTESHFCNPSYLLESEGGERVVLRCPIAKNIPLAVGDVGMVEYQGDYIRSFQLLERKETSSS